MQCGWQGNPMDATRQIQRIRREREALGLHDGQTQGALTMSKRERLDNFSTARQRTEVWSPM